MIEVFIRRPKPHELQSVRAMVKTVVDEVYGGVWAPRQLPTDARNRQCGNSLRITPRFIQFSYPVNRKF